MISGSGLDSITAIPPLPSFFRREVAFYERGTYLCEVSRNSLAHLALFAVAVIFGANYSIAKLVMDPGYLQPLPFILLRISVGGLLFWLFHWFFVRESIERKDIGRLILCGLLGVAINQSFFFMGLKYTTPISAAIIMTTTPILVLIASALLLSERITWRKSLGIAIGATGAILLVVYGQELSFSSSQALGNLLILVNATSYGLYFVLVKPLLVRYHPITIVKWIFLFGGLAVLPFAWPELQTTAWHAIDTSAWWAIGYVLLATTFLAYLFNAFALQTVTPATAAIYIYLQPFMAALIALSLGKDQMDLVKWAAGACIFAGVYLVSSHGR